MSIPKITKTRFLSPSDHNNISCFSVWNPLDMRKTSESTAKITPRKSGKNPGPGLLALPRGRASDS